MTAKRRFPAQFWLMFAGLVISTTGTSMIWPFITIYSSQKLGLPLTAVTSLLSINALTALAASIIAGSLVDHFGRKGIMTIGLFGQALAYLLYIPAREFWVFALLMGCLLYTSDAADDLLCVDLGGRRLIKKKNLIQIHDISKLI